MKINQALSKSTTPKATSGEPAGTRQATGGEPAGVATGAYQDPAAKTNQRQAVATKAPVRHFSARRFLRNLVFAAGVILWTLASYYAASHLGALIFSLWVDAGDLRSSAPLMALFLTIVYVIELILLILVPWGVASLWRRWGATPPRRSRATKQATTDTASPSAKQGTPGAASSSTRQGTTDAALLSAKQVTNDAPPHSAKQATANATPRGNSWAPTRQTLGLTGWPRWRDLALAPAGLIVSLIVSGVVISLCLNLPGFDASAEQNLGFDQYLIQWDLLAAFVALVIVPPICEEIAYRGWLYGKLRSRWGFVASSLLVSLTFAILHAPLNAAIVAFVLSFVACGLREITGSIYASILMHMLKNGIAFWLLYIVHLG